MLPPAEPPAQPPLPPALPPAKPPVLLPAAGFPPGLAPPPEPPPAGILRPTHVPSGSSRPLLLELSSSAYIFGSGILFLCLFWKFVINSWMSSVIHPLFVKALRKALVSPWLMKNIVKVSVVVTCFGVVGSVRWICFVTCFGAL